MDVTVGNTLGALAIGAMIAAYLFGIVTLQAYYYYQAFEKDIWKLKALSAFLWSLELTHTICVCAETYRITIIFYGRVQDFTYFPYLGTATLIGGIITVVVQVFFCFRVYKILPGALRWWGAGCGFVSIVRAVGGIFLGARALTSDDLDQYLENSGWLIRALLSSGAVIDVTIASSMLYFLTTRRDQAMKHTTKLIDHLVSYTVRTGLLTSITAVIVLICFQLTARTYIWVSIYSALAKLYSNSFYAALNGRETLRNVLADMSYSIDSRILRPDPDGARTPAAVAISIQMPKPTIGSGRASHSLQGKFALDV